MSGAHRGTPNDPPVDDRAVALSPPPRPTEDTTATGTAAGDPFAIPRARVPFDDELSRWEWDGGYVDGQD